MADTKDKVDVVAYLRQFNTRDRKLCTQVRGVPVTEDHLAEAKRQDTAARERAHACAR